GQLSVKANNGPLRDGKQSMYEGGLKVPACMVWPEKIAAGSHSDRLALTMDLFATVCETAGVRIQHTIDGESILPTLLGESQPASERDLFFHRREGGERYGGLTIHAIRRGDWKLLQNSPFAPMELYNLASDPGEENDLATDNRKVYREMLSALRVQFQRGGAVPWQRPSRRDVK
ncbi:MAG: sulfatase-like hydrolase/transferase, partial [Pirellulaceae bacterium]|nr:sulfatase-like hydrolase/transferase [Pirellulaceae bacterium]